MNDSSPMSQRALLDNLNTAVLTFDQALRLTSMNPAAEMLFANSARQVVGMPLSALLPENPELQKILQRCLDTGHLFTAHEQLLALHGGRQITVDFTITPLALNKENGLLLEMVQVDRLLRLSRDEAMQRRQTANRIVIRGLAHEIKNPLGGIRGAAQLLERELPNAALKEYTEVIIQEADRLRALVDRMFGPNQPLKSDRLNIHAVLDRVRRLLQAEIQGGIRIQCDYDPSLPDIEGDFDQLIQAFLNIARNSVEAMGKHGTLILRTRAERQFTVGHKRHRLMVRIDIEDDGPGIPEGLIENIFYPMVTGRPDGTGLGLSITQDIIAKHGGLIECSSQPQQTLFTVYIPVENDHGQS